MSRGDTPMTEIAIEGDLLFSTVVSKRDVLLDQLKGLQGTVRLNLSAVSRVDSSALSLWLCCQRFAKSQSLILELVNAPDELRSIAQLVGIDEQSH